MIKLNYVILRRTVLVFSSILILNGFMYSQNRVSDNKPTEPNIHPTWTWAAAQLVPSPQWVTSANGLRFGMRWQITPLLYSFGINKKLSPWRYLIAEPLVRQSGSVELFFSPDYLKLEDKFKDRWLFRGGARAYIPLWQRGEYMSASLGVSYYNFNGQNGISYEGGIYLFAGILGIQTTYSPSFTNSEWIFTLRLRYF